MPIKAGGKEEFKKPLNTQKIIESSKTITIKSQKGGDLKKELKDEKNNIKLGAEAKERNCTCKNSSCAKNYCVCFSAGISCNSKCHCIECLNIEENNLMRDKVGKESVRCFCGTNCRKNYCNCKKNNQFCNKLCRCTDCENFKI